MKPIQFTFEAIGTKWIIDIYNPLTVAQEAKLLTAIQKRIEKFDKTYSRFRDDSLITKIAQKEGIYVFPPDGEELLTLYHNLYKITDGTFTPLIGSVLADAGYDASYSLKSHTLHTPPNWEEIIEYSHPNLIVRKPVLLDFGAAGKGYLVDIIGKLLQAHDITTFCIDASGDILYNNPSNKVMKVGLEHPENPEQVIGVIEVVNQSICGSAGNRRKWGRFHHIINPHTLTSPEDIKAVWVIARTGLLADALTTCLFFVPPSNLMKYYDFAYIIVKNDYTIIKSENLPGDLFYKNQNNVTIQ